MKKSLMAAALVALSSTAFADKDSFVVGISGQYFKSFGESKCEMNRKPFPTNAVEDTNKSKQFFISPYVGYNINEMFRVGFTVMFNPLGNQFKRENVTFSGNKATFDTLIAEITGIAGTADLDISLPANKGTLDKIIRATTEMPFLYSGADHTQMLTDWPTAKAAQSAITNTHYKELVGILDQVFAPGSTAPVVNITDCYKPLPMLVTGDAKLFENSILSVSAGLGLGMTRWSHEYKFTHGADNKELKDPAKYETASAWSPSAKVDVSAHFNLADIATLSVSGGYLHLGAPDKFNHGDEKDKKEVTVSKDLPSSGLLLSVGVSKEF